VAHKTDEQKRMFNDSTIRSIAAEHGATPAQIALAWVLREPDLIAIPKASRTEHISQNRAAVDIQLTDDDLEKLDEIFPPPKRKIPLEMI
jgi:diketogulonate reductase-like aldo/keto reductase